jgi:hypothetical protein
VLTDVRPNDPKTTQGHKVHFQVRFAGDATHRRSRSGVITVVVRPAKA